MIGVPVWIVASILVVQTSIHAQTEDTTGPVSINRIRAALEHQPSPLRLPPSSTDVPTFRVTIRGSLPMPPPAEKPFDPTYGLPSLGDLMMDGIAEIRDYKRRHTERRAGKEVGDALAAFCAANACSKK